MYVSGEEEQVLTAMVLAGGQADRRVDLAAAHIVHNGVTIGHHERLQAERATRVNVKRETRGAWIGDNCLLVRLDRLIILLFIFIKYKHYYYSYL